MLLFKNLEMEETNRMESKDTLIAEFNALGIPGLQVDDLNLLIGSYVNLEYPRSRFPETKDVMGLWRMTDIFWSATTSATARSPGLSVIKKEAADEKF